jgi:putative ABC transport system permease protein
MDSFLQDLKYATRALLRRPWFSVLAVLTLAVGIGVNAVAYSAINALLGKPMRFPGAEQLGWIQTTGGTSPYNQTSLPDYLDLARENRTFAAIIAESRLPLSLAADGPAEQVWSLVVSANYLETMRARPIMGRTLNEGDGRGPDLAVVVSERFWKDRLNGGDSIAGHTLSLNGSLFSIVGVLPEGFQGPGGLYEPDLWLPLERLPLLKLSPALAERQTAWLTVAGRMKEGVTSAQAQADLRGIMEQLARGHPATNTGRSVSFSPVTNGVPELRRIAQLAWVGLAVVGIVLLIACFNVAGLLLARAAERQREIGVRTALGATRGRILRQLLVEGLLLASASGAAALLLAAWSADLLSAFSLPSPIPQRLHFVLDARIIGFTLALIALAGVLPALIPALQASRSDVRQVMGSQPVIGVRRSRVRNLFVLAQVAGSTLFLAAALLFVRSFSNAASFAPGFDVERTLVLELSTASFGYDDQRAQSLFGSLVERLRAVSGIEAVALADRAPLSVGFPRTVDVAGDFGECSGARCRSAIEFGISADHFAALGLALRAGRELTEQEVRANAPVVVVGEGMAQTLWPQRDPVGQSLRVGRDRRLVEVIGVAADVRDMFSADAVRSYLYRPLRAGEYADRVSVIVRTTGDPAPFVPIVRQQVQAIDPALPATAINTTRERMKLPSWPARTAAGFLLVCGALALGLASVGLFGVTFYTVSQRTREFGVRVALGATPGQVMALVMREGLMLTVPGVIAGIAGAILALRLASRLLVGVGAADPSTYIVTAVLQTLVAMGACALPAMRAMRADPMKALRDE